MKVALLAEGVDRNILDCKSPFELGVSPSSRRAWAEMFVTKLRMLNANRNTHTAKGEENQR